MENLNYSCKCHRIRSPIRIGSDSCFRIGSDPPPRIGSEYPLPEPPEVFCTQVRADILLEQLVRFGSDPNRLDLLLHTEFDLFSWHNRLLQLRIGLHLAKHDLVTTFPRSPFSTAINTPQHGHLKGLLAFHSFMVAMAEFPHQ